jgi:hypothetical protein
LRVIYSNKKQQKSAPNAPGMLSMTKLVDDAELELKKISKCKVGLSISRYYNHLQHVVTEILKKGDLKEAFICCNAPIRQPKN